MGIKVSTCTCKSEHPQVSVHSRLSSLFETAVMERFRYCRHVNLLTAGPSLSVASCQFSFISSLAISPSYMCRRLGAVAPAPSRHRRRVTAVASANLRWRAARSHQQCRFSAIASVPFQPHRRYHPLASVTSRRYPCISKFTSMPSSNALASYL